MFATICWKIQWLLNAIASTLSELKEKEQPIEILKNSQEKSIEPTMTIWGTDPLSTQETKKLLLFIDSIGRNQCYTDTSADVNPKSTTIQSTLFPTTALSDKVFLRCMKIHNFSLLSRKYEGDFKSISFFFSDEVKQDFITHHHHRCSS